MATVDINSFKGNSFSEREKRKTESKKVEKNKLTPVIRKENIVSTKKPLTKKLSDYFVSEDIKDVKSYILYDYVIPGIKNGVLSFLSMMFFKEPYDSRYRRDDHYSRYDYGSSYYRGRKERENREARYHYEEEKLDYRDVVLKNRSDAERIVTELRERIRIYGHATIADLFDLIGTTSEIVDNDWGWTRPESIGIKRMSSGFLIDVDKAKHLD